MGCILAVIAMNAGADISDITAIYKNTPMLDAFEVCQGGGGADRRQVSLNDEEWAEITAIFTDADDVLLDDATRERKQIAEAIGALEKIIGDKVGTSEDRAGTFDNSDYAGQMDCNDEAINSTTYMRLMVQNGLIRLHQVEDMRTRNFFFTGWPHSTAVIHEVATGERYAVDSWFYDNGEPAIIVPFALWKSGYIPENSPLRHVRSAHYTDSW